jgi:hypothetical protein
LLETEEDEGADGGNVGLNVHHDCSCNTYNRPQSLDTAGEVVGGDLGDGADFKGEKVADEGEADEDREDHESEEGDGNLLAAPWSARGTVTAEPGADCVRVRAGLILAVEGEKQPMQDSDEEGGHLPGRRLLHVNRIIKRRECTRSVIINLRIITGQSGDVLPFCTWISIYEHPQSLPLRNHEERI